MTAELSKYCMKTLQADCLTPIAIFQAIEGNRKVLFESNAKYDESGRYSFIAVQPIAELKGDGEQSVFQLRDEPAVEAAVPVIARLKDVLPMHETVYPFKFFGGAIGYFGYETAFHFEQIGEVVNDVYNMPDVHVYFYDTFIIFDHVLQTVTVAAIDLFGDRSEQAMATAVQTLEAQLQLLPQQPYEQPATNFQPTMEKAHFIELVEQAKAHIRRGDIFQVVLSQTFQSAFTGDPLMLYRKLRTSNPSPYMFYMAFDDYTVLGTSPESLVKVEDGIVTTNPIAGTKPRGATKEQDEAIAAALLHDEKELAEHKMLVDLGRNDVGRVSKVGSVYVSKYMTIERYKYVMHIVSEVKGTLRDDAHVLDVLASSLPAGTVSGAPKIRAMQIIRTLEQKKRGIYAGAIGYVSVTGNMDLALAIRTMVVKDGQAYVQAGAGIVYDSVPESEYEETLNKARALLEGKK